MNGLLGHLAQFGTFSQQGELLCTQGLAYLLRDTEGERVFMTLISLATGHSFSPGLSRQAESRQEDGARPDLEGRNAESRPVIKVEAKLGAPFGPVVSDVLLMRSAHVEIPSRLRKARTSAPRQRATHDVDPLRVAYT